MSPCKTKILKNEKPVPENFGFFICAILIFAVRNI